MDIKNSWFGRFIIWLVHRKQRQIMEDVFPTAQGRPVEDIRADLVAAMKKRRTNFPDELLDEWAASMHRGQMPELYTPEM